MPTILHYGNAVQTRFEVPGSLKKTVYVGGVGVTPASSDFQSVTLSVVPGSKVPVQIDWDGDGLDDSVKQGVLTDSQVTSVQSLVDGSGISNASYNGGGKLVSYSKGAVDFTVTYPDAATAVFSSSEGNSRTVTFDEAGRVSAIV